MWTVYRLPTVWVQVAPDTRSHPRVDRDPNRKVSQVSNADLIEGPSSFLESTFKALLVPPCLFTSLICVFHIGIYHNRSWSIYHDGYWNNISLYAHHEISRCHFSTDLFQHPSRYFAIYHDLSRKANGKMVTFNMIYHDTLRYIAICINTSERGNLGDDPVITI